MKLCGGNAKVISRIKRKQKQKLDKAQQVPVVLNQQIFITNEGSHWGRNIFWFAASLPVIIFTVFLLCGVISGAVDLKTAMDFTAQLIAFALQFPLV
jgi:hypothetical protein